MLAAAISPDNTPHGYNLTFAFPMLMFIIIAALLYLRFRSPHRVPGPVVAGPEPEGTTGGSTLHGVPVVEGPVVEGTEPDESEDGE